MVQRHRLPVRQRALSLEGIPADCPLTASLISSSCVANPAAKPKPLPCRIGRDMRYYVWYHASEAPTDAAEHVRPPDAGGHPVGGHRRDAGNGRRGRLRTLRFEGAPEKGAERMILHRPHPAPETGRGAVRAIVALLEAAGVKP